MFSFKVVVGGGGGGGGGGWGGAVPLVQRLLNFE